MSDEWGTERLDLDAYLRRIAFDATPAPDAPTLAALHRAHVAAIGFENLDVMLGRGIDPDLDGVQAKLVDRRRGGYCYEHGVLFSAALERIGFPVERLLARIGGDLERPRARTHMVLRVRTEEGWWLADVGFGSGLLEPLALRADGPHSQGGWTYELAEIEPGHWALRELRDGEWATAYHFDEQPQHASDVAVANHYSSTYPGSPFVARMVAVRKDEEAVHRLLGRELSTTLPDWSVEARPLAGDELGDVLRSVFGLDLAADELSRLRALPTQAPSGRSR
jgi:N-hydroxyarylamine O-acetyltransferase